MGARTGGAAKTGGKEEYRMTYRTMSVKGRTACQVLAALTATTLFVAAGGSQAWRSKTRKGRPAPAKPASPPNPHSPRSPAAPPLSNSRPSRPGMRRS